MNTIQHARARFETWNQRIGCAAQIGIGSVALIILCAGCGSSSDGATGNGGAAPATPTPPAAAGAAILGGSGQAFIAKYGPLTNQSDQAQGDLHFKQYPGVATDYLIVDEGKHFAVTPGDTAAYTILVAAPPSQPWSLTAAKNACTGFIPTDAQFVKTVATVNPQSNVVDGLDVIYTSASLAKTFPASSFQDASQNQAPAGSFDIWYLDHTEGDGNYVDSCSIMVGEQQTTG